jgi:hypothetical protein
MRWCAGTGGDARCYAGRTLATAALLILCLAASAQASDPATTRAVAELADYHPDAAVAALAQAARTRSLSPFENYLMGLALYRGHHFGEAKPWLDKAKAGGFEEWLDWPKTSVLLGWLAEIGKLWPPEVPADGANSPALPAFADNPSDPWCQAVLSHRREAQRVARRLYGEHAPALPLILLTDRPRYDRLFKLLTESDFIVDWQDGTGMAGFAIFCTLSKGGKHLWQPDNREAVAAIYHEYGHALAMTYIGDGFGDRVPRWLNEGIAEFTAQLICDPGRLDRAWARIKGAHLPGSLDELEKRFYTRPDAWASYGLAAGIMSQITVGRRPRVAEEILSRIKSGATVATAVKAACDVDPEELFRRALRGPGEVK